MATGPRYRIAFRRRREGKTNYRRRKAFVISGLPRLVVRRTLKRVIAQVIKAEIIGDKVLVSADSTELARQYDWLGNRSNLPASYLTGLLCGLKALASGVKEAVLDIGLQSPTKGAKLFATLKGALDAGIMIPHDENVLPSEKRIHGEHIVAYAKQLASNPEVYQTRFSELLSRGLPPENITEHFLSVKEKIVSSFKGEKAPKDKRVEVKLKAKSHKKITRKATAKPKRRVSTRKKREIEK